MSPPVRATGGRNRLLVASIQYFQADRNVIIASGHQGSDRAQSAKSSEVLERASEPQVGGQFALTDHWKFLANAVDAALEANIGKLGNGCPERLRAAIGYSLLSPGKRLRPVLCLLTCEALGASHQVALSSACALEMIHCYSLIHDDLPAMDDDDLRRGRKTCHREFDEATAILAGDALQPLAFETILTSSMPDSVKVQSALVLSRAAGSVGMVGGQMDDLLGEKRPEMLLGPKGPEREPGEQLSSIHRRKTGAMIEASVVLGALAAGATTECLNRVAKYGQGIGIAFQITDDLLDVESTVEKTGKATGKDAQRGKLTFPGLYGVEESRRMADWHVSEAINALEELGQEADGLRQLAMYILKRNT